MVAPPPSGGQIWPSSWAGCAITLTTNLGSRWALFGQGLSCVGVSDLSAQVNWPTNQPCPGYSNPRRPLFVAHQGTPVAGSGDRLRGTQHRGLGSRCISSVLVALMLDPDLFLPVSQLPGNMCFLVREAYARIRRWQIRNLQKEETDCRLPGAAVWFRAGRRD